MTGNDVTVEDKSWGVTRKVFEDQTHSIWHASPKAGGFSSRHRHHKMPNKFYVVSGTLLVEVYATKPSVGDGPLHTVTLTAGQEATVVEGVWHRFVAKTDVELIEIYWAHLKEGGDIERVDLGGLSIPA